MYRTKFFWDLKGSPLQVMINNWLAESGDTIEIVSMNQSLGECECHHIMISFLYKENS